MPAGFWRRWRPIRKRPKSSLDGSWASAVPRFFFLRGAGHVVGVTKKGVALALKDGNQTADVLLPTGLLFGNAVRDGTGLLDVSAFPNSQNFNDLSTGLNRIVETTLLPQLREQAKIGAKISFVGCAEVEDEDSDARPVKVIPVALKIELQK